MVYQSQGKENFSSFICPYYTERFTICKIKESAIWSSIYLMVETREKTPAV
jgi:hypothetical protein